MKRHHIVLLLFVALTTVARIGNARSPGLSESTVAAVDELLTQKMAQNHIPGLSVAIVVGDELVWSRGYGFADVENSVPATTETAYRTASIGKLMTAVAVMQLVEQGTIDLDGSLSLYCPEFPAKRWTITPRQLLSHTSGIRHYGGPHNEEELFNTVHYDHAVDALAIFENDPLLFEPGTRYQYSTFGYDVLGCVIEGASGSSYLEYMQNHVFDPAGMEATRDDDPAAIVPHRASGYALTEGGELVNCRPVDMSSKLPAGGFVTTAEDLAQFARALMNHELVDAQTLELMRTPARLQDGTIVPYGLGLGLFPGEDWYGEREAFHGGVTPGVSGMLYMLPDRKFAVAILMNLEAISGRTQLSAQVAKQVLRLGEK